MHTKHAKRKCLILTENGVEQIVTTNEKRKEQLSGFKIVRGLNIYIIPT